jgi:hypothetical protein
MFGPKMEELHSEEHRNLYASSLIMRVIKSRRLRWARHEARMEEFRNACKILIRKPEGKRPLGRQRRRWEDMRMCVRELGWEGVDWIHLAQDRDQWRAVVNTIWNLWVP